MILTIITEPNSILRQKSTPLLDKDFNNSEIKKFITDLTETMYASDGVGIAAPQVAKPVQICIIAKNFTDGNDRDLVLVNPEWKKMTTKKTWGDEGCLSVPNVFGKVQRYNQIKVNALDAQGQKISFVAQGFFARIIQHEIDHLNGILFIDKAKNLQRLDDQIL